MKIRWEKRGNFYGIDSMYKFKEIKKIPEEKKKTDYKKMSQELKQMTASLIAGELDQQWIKENENKENSFSTPTQKSEDEQTIDDILARFKKIRESNNSMRSQMRKQQLSPLQQFQETQQWIDSMTGGKSR